MCQVAGRKLWLGQSGGLRAPRALRTAGIEAVVELADSEQMAILPRELIRRRFPLSDGGTTPPWLLRMATESVAGRCSCVHLLFLWPQPVNLHCSGWDCRRGGPVAR